MDKKNDIPIPLSVTLAETKNKLESALNDSKLHICILDMLVSELYHEIHLLAEKQSRYEKQNYLKQQNNEKDKEE